MSRQYSLLVGFLSIVLIGAIVLMSPWMRTEGTWGSFNTALFMSCSATSVTGLTLVDVAQEWNLVGRAFFLLLVQIGGLGLMTLTTFMLVAVGRRLSLSREFSLMNAYGIEQVHGLRGLIFWTVGSTFVIEGIGAIIFSWRLGSVYDGIFYSIVSFCNAGFALRPDSIASYAGDTWFVLTMAFEILAGGIGFLVIYNLFTFRFRRREGVRGRISLHTQVVLRMTFWVLMVMVLAFLVVEWNGTLGEYSPFRKVLVAFFQGVTPRTAGFTIVPMENLHPFTRFLTEVEMFIGGAPGSTAGGLKLTTMAVLIYTITALCRGDRETVITRKLIPVDIVRESLVILSALLLTLLLIMGALLLTDGRSIPIENLFFECLSSLTTTGLSFADTTARMSVPGQYVLMVSMTIGRLGALAVVMMIGNRETNSHVRFPVEELVVG